MQILHLTSKTYVEKLIEKLVQASIISRETGNASEFQMIASGEVNKFIIDVNRDLKESVKELLPLKIEVLFNNRRNGIDIKFSRYPGEPGEKLILRDLKVDGFRWSSRQKLWYRKNDGNFDYYKDKYTR